MVNVPLQGTPGVADFRNPTLLPNYDQPAATGAGGTCDLLSPSQFLVSNPRANATQTVTLSGTITNGDVIALQVNCGTLPGGALAVTVPVVTADTLATLAQKFAKGFNDSSAAQGVGLEVDAGGASGAVLTFNWPGPIGNLANITSPQPESIIITASGTAVTGDNMTVTFTGGVIGATPVVITAASTTGNTATQQAQALKTAINANTTLSGLGITATGAAAALTISAPTAGEPPTVAAFVNVAAPTITIGGSITAGDTIALKFTYGAAQTAYTTAAYIVLVADTTTTIAQALKNIINTDVNLVAANITATGAAAVLTVNNYPTGYLFRTPAATITGSATESVTLTTAPTDVLTITESATEVLTIGGTNGFLTGGSGPIIPYNNFQYSINFTLSNFRAGQPRGVGLDVLTKMVAEGQPII